MAAQPSSTSDTLAGRVAVVTGGGTGIGLGIVEQLLAAGARVAFFGHDPTKVEAALTRLQGWGEDRVYGTTADVTEQAQVEGLFRTVYDRWGSVEILVNNAGISPKRQGDHPWTTAITLAEWRRVIEVDLTACFLCAQLAAPAMIEQRYGRIISISSLAGRAIPKIAGPHYAAAKAGIGGFTRSLAADLGKHGITVNAVAPGRIFTEMSGSPDSEINRLALARIPVGRLGQPKDVAAVVTFLASDAAGFINGATIDVNGGEFSS
jgi:3-oxoacyl-[acyl-carrier protein] reductase